MQSLAPRAPGAALLGVVAFASFLKVQHETYGRIVREANLKVN